MGGAVFSDVEGTLIDGSIPQLALAAGLAIKLFSPWQRLQIGALELVARLSPAKFVRTVRFLALLRATAGLDEQQVKHWVNVLTPTIMRAIKPAILARIKAHQTAGLSLVLVSGGLHEGIADLGLKLGGRGEGTKLRQRNGRYQGRLDGSICQGVAKRERAEQVIAERGYDPAQSYGYGDTAGDIPFLQLFGYPHAVDPDAELTAEARRRGWPIVISSQDTSIDHADSSSE